jgi:2'-5' RNA ligase
MSEHRRLFFALLPEPDALAGLVAILDGLSRLRGRPVRPPNLHLTLAFIGAADAGMIACLRDRAAAVRAAPFELSLDRLGHFPRSGVLWLGSSEPQPALLDLVAALNVALSPCGYEPERRPYAPHVTLMRKLGRRPRLATPRPVSWRAREFVLMESIPEPGGVSYRSLEAYPLSQADRI